MRKFWWRIRLLFWFQIYHYHQRKRFSFFADWKWTNLECWIDYFDCGESPKGAILEDLSYA